MIWGLHYLAISLGLFFILYDVRKPDSKQETIYIVLESVLFPITLGFSMYNSITRMLGKGR